MTTKAAAKVRLPKYIRPLKYNLQIQPDMEAFTFIGNEAIKIELDKSVKEITLHCKELEITDGWWKQGKSKIDITKTTYNKKAETVTFSFGSSLNKGQGELHLHFRGIIQENLRGFYRSQYIYKGKSMRIATTQFEATDARRAFPCFDEPAQKAVFEVTLVVPKHMTAISNALESPIPAGLSHDQGYKVVKFAPTPKMSTYLLAFIIGDFEFIEAKIKGKNPVNIRVFATPGKKEQARFALDIAQRSLEFLNKYFGIPYPLPVLDLIAIPDFSAGAMENWGAVTFREAALLLDEKNTAFANRQQIAETIAHELVHQWFGNLVTMEWWTHLWLNESFASFMSYVVLDDIFPEWKIWTRFVMHDHANALHLDSLQNTHPIEVEVHHPSQISEIFDAISYDKGASVLHMLMHYIGPQNFRKGLSLYLKKHSYKNTASIHLWEAFENVSGKPVKKFIANWIEKPGYPMVAVTKSAQGKVTVSQSRFSLRKHSDSTVWPVPVQFELGKGLTSDLTLLSKKTAQVSVPKYWKFLKANPNETGFYRTLYDPSLLTKLYEPVRQKELGTIDRFGIIRDLFAMAKSGHLPTSAYLEFLKAYKDEDSYIIWSEVLSGMGEIYNLFAGKAKEQRKLASYYRKILKGVAESVGWESNTKETQTRALLRAAVLTHYGLYGDKAALKRARVIFAKRKIKPIAPDLRVVVYSLTAKQGNKATLAELKRIYSKETLQEEQRRIGKAMVLINNRQLLLKALDFALSKEVRTQDAPILIALSLMNSDNREIAWQWVQKNWSAINTRYHDDHLIVWIVKSLSGFSTKQRAQEIKRFFAKHPVPAAERAVKQVLEQIELHAAWLKRDYDCINDSLGL